MAAVDQTVRCEMNDPVLGQFGAESIVSAGLEIDGLECGAATRKGEEASGFTPRAGKTVEALETGLARRALQSQKTWVCGIRDGAASTTF